MTVATAIAHSNIALAKYWGKADVARNLPAVPSLSLTLDGLSTRTTVAFAADLQTDHVDLDGSEAAGRAATRVVELLDRVRALSGRSERAHVSSHNDFPTASGLASSASGFAALALAALAAAGATPNPSTVSALARESSASAARSVFGGFAVLLVGAASAEPLAPPEHWPVSMLVAVVTSQPKKVSSTTGMQHTAASSPYYPSWVQTAPRLYAEVRDAVLARDLGTLGPAMEHSSLLMHASMLAARPPLAYFEPTTWRLLRRVAELREARIPAYATMDAGPHVKVLTERAHEQAVRAALAEVSDVERVIVCRPGGPARLTTDADA